MRFDHPATFTVIRAAGKPDPYTAGATIPDWDRATEATIAGFLAHDVSSEAPDLNRSELAESATLTIAEYHADVRLGDRIREEDGRLWQVTGIPISEMNPFTGWRPVTVVRLERWEG